MTAPVFVGRGCSRGRGVEHEERQVRKESVTVGTIIDRPRG